jgi:hypothetical protein
LSADTIRSQSWLFDQEWQVRETEDDALLGQMWQRDSNNTVQQLGFYELLFLPRSSLEDSSILPISQVSMLPADMINQLDGIMDSLQIDTDARPMLREVLLAKQENRERRTTDSIAALLNAEIDNMQN